MVEISDHRNSLDLDQEQNTDPMQDSDSRFPHSSRSPLPSAGFIHRSNTDSSLEKSTPCTRDQLYPQPYRPDPTPRPSSRQSLGPPSPFPYSADSMASERQREAPRQEKESSEGRTTPTQKQEDIDVRALVQKHDELRMFPYDLNPSINLTPSQKQNIPV